MGESQRPPANPTLILGDWVDSEGLSVVEYEQVEKGRSCRTQFPTGGLQRQSWCSRGGPARSLSVGMMERQGDLRLHLPAHQGRGIPHERWGSPCEASYRAVPGAMRP